MVCITLFPASNCILSASSSRREEREALKFLSLVFQYDRKDRSDRCAAIATIIWKPGFTLT